MLRNINETLRYYKIEREWEQDANHVVPPLEGGDIAEWMAIRRPFVGKWNPVPISPQDRERIRRLKNYYKGQRIFLIGNGPSLNQTPMEKLANEYTFGVNRIYLMFDRISWRPTFYTTQDWRVTPDNAHEINGLNGMTFFFPQRFYGLLRTGEDVYWYSSLNSAPDTEPIEKRFSDDMKRGAVGGGTVMATVIQIAAYLGFSPMYLIGVDASYTVSDTVKQSGPDRFKDGIKLHLESTKDDDSNHFDPRYFGKGKKWHNPNVPEMIRGFTNMKQGVEKQGKRIFNATVGGKLEVFDRVNIHDLVT